MYRSIVPRKPAVLIKLLNLNVKFSCSILQILFIMVEKISFKVAILIFQMRFPRAVRYVFFCKMRVFSLLLRCVETFQESFKSLAIIPTKNKTDARVDGAI